MASVLANSLYLVVEGPLWTDAKTSAETIGGKLASINSAEENQFLQDNIDFTGFETGPTDPHCFWIGLYYSSNTWKWLDGTSVEENGYANWQPGDPDFLGQEVYGKISPGENAYWANEVNNDSTFGEAPNVSFGISEIPLNLSITTSSTPTEGAGVFTTSINLSAGTETSGNLAEGAEVYWSISGITEDDLGSGALEGFGSISNGFLEIEHSLIEDNDSGESFNVSVFSDADKTQQTGNTKEFAIGDIYDTTPPTISVAIDDGTDGFLHAGKPPLHPYPAPQPAQKTAIVSITIASDGGGAPISTSNCE